jgi:hypothetical protein
VASLTFLAIETGLRERAVVTIVLSVAAPGYA